MEDVFKIYDDFIDSLVDINPLRIMQKIAEQFGYDLIFGKRVEKYIIEERIRIPKVSNPNEFMNNLIGNYIKIPDMFSKSPPHEHGSAKALTDTKAMLEQGIDNDFSILPSCTRLTLQNTKIIWILVNRSNNNNKNLDS